MIKTLYISKDNEKEIAKAEFREMVEGVESDYPKAKTQKEHDLQVKGVKHAVKTIKDQLLTKLGEAE